MTLFKPLVLAAGRERQLQEGDYITRDTWLPLTLQNNWVSNGSPYPAPSYKVDFTGIVYFRGAVRGGADKSVAFTLPIGVRPTYPVASPLISRGITSGVPTLTLGGAGVLIDPATGQATIQNALGVNSSLVDLSGFSYPIL